MRILGKILINIFALLFLFSASFTAIKEYSPDLMQHFIYQEPCAKPLDYEIGNIDARFNITFEEAESLLLEAENIWEKASGKNLFRRNAGASLRINFVFDGRQQEANEAKKLKDELAALEAGKAELDKQYAGFDKAYDRKLAAFTKDVIAHKEKLEAYNKKVEYWNEQGGAPEEEYEQLKKTRKEINQNYEKLKKKEGELGELAAEINKLARQENRIVDSYNFAVATFRNKYGGSREFEKGVFDPAAGITIYQFEEKDDLLLVLIHELGHSLGIGHVSDPKSIMHQMIGEQRLENPELTSEDLAELRNVCRIK